MERLAEVLKRFSFESSFHGIKHVFGRLRQWRQKLTWALICVISFCCFFYFLVLSFEQHVIKQPIVTDMQYFTHSQVHFPQVLFCPTLPNQTVFDSFFQPSVSELFGFLASFSEHPIFAGIRNELRQNLTSALAKYPYLEQNWHQMFTSGNPDEATALFFGLSFPLPIPATICNPKANCLAI